ncbi:heavy metal translocating P-type ATPase [Leptospira idonii]|uniref:Heavy metal translocating P-type ATPase n=1 Tax=Leptospira idonii TaxID=1193500 RepID=A0A4V3JXW9_9LEPT|nr:heavy metal translocating P-type ATPase [Leptospira idonii]TGN18766.1 heavy metal translocating P-type ATPase [Leptospira idonii]
MTVSTLQSCFHCNSPIETLVSVEKEGVRREYCCQGCATVSALLLENGLDQFYQIRGTQVLEPKRTNQEKDSEDVDTASVYEEFVDKVSETESSVLITISGIHCSACVWLIETAMTQTQGISEARINFGTGRLKLVFRNGFATLGEIFSQIRSLGYTPHLYSRLKESKVSQPFRDLAFRMATAGFCWGNIMLFSASLYVGYFEGMEWNIKNLFHYLSWILATPVYFYSGYPFWKGAYESWKRKILSMDTLLFAGVSLAYFYSVYVTLTGKGEVYFDSVCTIYFFILLGKYLEAMIRYQAGAKMGELLSSLPEEYDVKTEDGWEKKATSSIRKEDTVRLVHGNRVPVDGKLLTEESFFDESFLTGESNPIRKEKGDTVKAGSLSLSSGVLLLSYGTAKESSLAQIGKLLEDSLLAKPKIQRLTDKLASVFIKIVLLFAIGTFIYWFYVSSLETAILNTISILIVACPCALGLSVPAALVVGHLLQSKKGVLVKNPETAEILAKADRIFFDKTGTLTTGKLELKEEIVIADSENKEHYLDLAIDLETHSSHPIAKAFVKTFSQNRSSSNFDWQHLEEIAGQGMSAKDREGNTYHIGTKNFATESNYKNDGKIYFSKNRIPLLSWEFGDKPRTDAKETIRKLKEMIPHLEILSGDIEPKVKSLADELEIANYSSQLSPSEKRDRILEAQDNGEIVVMLGDGINDSACIAQSNLGISMGMGSDLSLDRSDMILIQNRLDSLPGSIAISRKTRTIILQNIVLSLIYNSIMIPLAAFGYMLPVICAGFMTLSSFTVVLNSVSMKRRVSL